MSKSSHQSGIAGDTAFRPTARTLDLVTTESKDEVLVYDLLTHHIHHVKALTAAVWRACDGTRTVEQLVHDTGLGLESVHLALRQLDQAALLDAPLPEHVRGTESRRAFMKKVGIAAVPTIISISAPVAKAAASGGTALCTLNDYFCESHDQCCSKYCFGLEQEDPHRHCQS